MFSKYIWLLPLFMSVIFLYSHDNLSDTVFNFVSKWLNVIESNYSNANGKRNIKSTVKADHKVFTQDELKKYTNLEDGLYISILGQVFDVTKGAKHYAPGATYHAFTGRDASLAFITGEFDNEDLTDISSLSMQQVKALNDWVQFYNKNYVYKGKLSSRFYNKDGTPTEESQNVQNILIHMKEKHSDEQHRKRMFPPCNIEWKPDSGTVVWCTKRSGGIERKWIGVPRMLFESPSSKEYRCACVNLDSKEYYESKGMLREYPKCPKTSVKCAVTMENS